MKRTLPVLLLAIAAATVSAQTPKPTKADSAMQMENNRQLDKKMQLEEPSMLPDPKMPPVPRMPMETKSQPEPRYQPEPKSQADPKVMPEPKITQTKMIPANTVSTANLTGWPEQSRMAVEEITGKYGQADVVSDNELIWWNRGVWKKICINKTETKHSFPIEHTDMLQSTVSYKVPVGKMDDLGRFDGSITFDRTQGTMSARCDVEANNILALNLAHEIVIGKLSVSQARFAFASIVKEKMNGGKSAYMEKLLFEPQASSADADVNITGLTKADVVKGIKKNANK